MLQLRSLCLLLLLLSAQIYAAPLELIHTIPIGKAPHGMRFYDGSVHVALSGDDAIGVVDLQSNRVIRKWPVEHVPLDLIQSGSSWLVAPFRADYIQTMDVASGQTLQRWTVGSGPSLFSPKIVKNKAYIVSEFADRLTVFDLLRKKIDKTYLTGDRPYPADISHDGVLAFVPNWGEHTVSVIDLLNQKEITRTPVCKEPEGGALTVDEVHYIVACGGSDQLMWINTASFKVEKSLTEKIGSRPFSVTVSEEGDWAFVNHAGADTIAVVDLSEHAVVDTVKVGVQPIVMRIHQEHLYVSNEVSGTLSVLKINSKPKPAVSGQKNRVLLLGMIHSGHRDSQLYSLERLKQIIRKVKPDLVLTEIPPNRLPAAIKDFRTLGRIEESRVKVFPEYTDVLFPLSQEINFEMIPTAAWNTQMNEYRRAALGQIRNDADRTEQWAEYQAASKAMDQLIGEKSDDPVFIHSSEYDALVKAGLEPYDRLFNDELGTGGWTTINQAHYHLIEKALNRYQGQGKQILITFGAGHKYWFLEQLRQRDDIQLQDYQTVMNAQ